MTFDVLGRLHWLVCRRSAFTVPQPGRCAFDRGWVAIDTAVCSYNMATTLGNTQVPDAGQLISSLSFGDDELPHFQPVEARSIDADVSRSQPCSNSLRSSKWHFSCASVDVAQPPGGAEAVRFLDAGLDCQEDVAVVQYGQSAIPEDLDRW